jgi:four helix bundle protein
MEDVKFLLAKNFAIRIVNLYKMLTGRKEFILSKQLLRSGTSIGANLAEARYAQSRSDFLSKCSIALKECNETAYWLELLHDTDFLSHEEFNSINKDCSELLARLVNIVKNIKDSLR